MMAMGLMGAPPASASPNPAAQARANVERLSIGSALGRTSAGTPTHYQSYNWSGYADDNTGGKKYSKVSASWVEPKVTCAENEEQMAAFWVGIDGFTSPSVEQDGTLAYCLQGKAYYYTWWEMYPTNAIQVVGDAKAGDHITSSVTYATGKYTLKVTDATTPSASFTTTQVCGAGTTCENSSTEWIGEAPSGARGELPLPRFTPWTVTGASATSHGRSGPISAFPDDSITMISDAGYNLATPGPLRSGGHSFTDYWNNSY